MEIMRTKRKMKDDDENDGDDPEEVMVRMIKTRAPECLIRCNKHTHLGWLDGARHTLVLELAISDLG